MVFPKPPLLPLLFHGSPSSADVIYDMEAPLLIHLLARCPMDELYVAHGPVPDVEVRYESTRGSAVDLLGPNSIAS